MEPWISHISTIIAAIAVRIFINLPLISWRIRVISITLRIKGMVTISRLVLHTGKRISGIPLAPVTVRVTVRLRVTVRMTVGITVRITVRWTMRVTMRVKLLLIAAHNIFRSMNRTHSFIGSVKPRISKPRRRPSRCRTRLQHFIVFGRNVRAVERPHSWIAVPVVVNEKRTPVISVLFVEYIGDRLDVRRQRS